MEHDQVIVWVSLPLAVMVILGAKLILQRAVEAHTRRGLTHTRGAGERGEA